MGRMVNRKTVTGVLAFTGSLACAWAQEAAASAAAAPAAVNGYGMSLKQAWEYGGWIMWVLAAISVFALAMVFYFMTVLRSGSVTPRDIGGPATASHPVSAVPQRAFSAQTL